MSGLATINLRARDYGKARSEAERFMLRMGIKRAWINSHHKQELVVSDNQRVGATGSVDQTFHQLEWNPQSPENST